MPMMESSRKRHAPGCDDEVSTKIIKKPQMVENSISCPICVTKTLKCYDLVHHLAYAHYSKELFRKYPLKDGDNCQLCIPLTTQGLGLPTFCRRTSSPYVTGGSQLARVQVGHLAIMLIMF